jgi:hypothetical protein
VGLVLAAFTQLRLARPCVEDRRLPWERRYDPGRLTPVRVRRVVLALLPDLGTPAKPPKTLRTLTGTAQRPPVGTSQTLPGHQEVSLRSRENCERESFAMYLKLIAKLLVVKTQAKSFRQ